MQHRIADVDRQSGDADQHDHRDRDQRKNLAALAAAVMCQQSLQHYSILAADSETIGPDQKVTPMIFTSYGYEALT